MTTEYDPADLNPPEHTADPIHDLEQRHRTLRTTMGGHYRREDVDSLVAHTVAALTARAQETANLHDRCDELEADQRALEATIASRDRSLNTAQQQLDELRAGAADDVVQMRVTERMADAHQRAEEIEQQALVRAQQVITEARQRAAQVLASAPAMAADAATTEGSAGMPARPAPTGDRIDDALARARWLEALDRFIDDERGTVLSDIDAGITGLQQAALALGGASRGTAPSLAPGPHQDAIEVTAGPPEGWDGTKHR